VVARNGRFCQVLAGKTPFSVEEKTEARLIGPGLGRSFLPFAAGRVLVEPVPY
jgi:hypothetical protein